MIVPIYIEILASHPSQEKLYRDPTEAFVLLAGRDFPDGSSEHAELVTALRRSAAEMAAVYQESTLATDKWTAKVWRADWYDATH